MYEHYGRDRAALCCTVMRFRPRGAIRDVGKALGLTEDVTGALAAQVWGGPDEGALQEHAAALNLNPGDRRLRLALELAEELVGFPRQLGTHPGGFVLTAGAAVRPGAGRAGGDGRTPGDRMGQGRHRRAQMDEGRCAGPGHAGLPAMAAST